MTNVAGYLATYESRNEPSGGAAQLVTEGVQLARARAKAAGLPYVDRIEYQPLVRRDVPMYVDAQERSENWKS